MVLNEESEYLNLLFLDKFSFFQIFLVPITCRKTGEEEWQIRLFSQLLPEKEIYL